MNEPCRNQFYTDELKLMNDKKFRDSFINDAQFNRWFLKDLNNLCYLKELFQIKQHLYKYGRLDYIYQLVFTIFSETPEKPRYEISGIYVTNKEILKLLWEYLYGSGYGKSWRIPLLPNPNDYKTSIIQGLKVEEVEGVENWLVEIFGENTFKETSQKSINNLKVELENIRVHSEAELYDDVAKENNTFNLISEDDKFNISHDEDEDSLDISDFIDVSV